MESENFIKAHKGIEKMFMVIFNKYQKNQKVDVNRMLDDILDLMKKFHLTLSTEQIFEINNTIETCLYKLKKLIIADLGKYEYELETLRSRILTIENFIK